MDVHNTIGGSLQISTEVIAKIARLAALEVDGVADVATGTSQNVRSLLGRSLGWRVTPELDFRIDTSTDEAERIARALEVVPPTLGVEKDEFGYPVAAPDAAAGPAEAPEDAPEPDEA